MQSDTDVKILTNALLLFLYHHYVQTKNTLFVEPELFFFCLCIKIQNFSIDTTLMQIHTHKKNYYRDEEIHDVDH